MDFLGNQTGVAKKNNINVIRLVPARIESGRGRKSLGWRATSEKGREKGNSLGWSLEGNFKSGGPFNF